MLFMVIGSCVVIRLCVCPLCLLFFDRSFIIIQVINRSSVPGVYWCVIHYYSGYK